MHYRFIYDESAKTILIKQSKKGLCLTMLVALIFIGGAGVVMICAHTTIGQLLGGIFTAIGCCVIEMLIVLGYYKFYIVMDSEGIRFRDIRQNKHFLWRDCKFIGKWIAGGRYSGTGLVFCRQEVQREANGMVSLHYPWPDDDTISLRGVWDSLSYKQQQQILTLCGGPRG